MTNTSLSKLEKEALELIRKNRGILQSSLWRQLGLDSREGSRLVLRLVRKGLVKREQVLVNGRRTYKLFPVEARAQERKLIINIESILMIPCTTCPLFHKCGLEPEVSPETCPQLDIWLERMRSKKRELMNT